jgi:D-glycero-alpha-D-manno-heptose-7-phosphate kinase
VIISSAPLRISFCGGGTDYKNFFQKYGGGVIGAAINQRVYVFVNSLSKFSEENIRFTYRITESVNEIDSINHPVVRVALKELGISEKINIATMADVPGNSGLGSSSAFTVALVGGLAKFKGIILTPKEIVALAYKIEREILSEPGGVQDFLHATHGSLRFYEMSKKGLINDTELLNPELKGMLEKRMALIKVGPSRESAIHAKITAQASNDSGKLNALHENLELTIETMKKFSYSSDPEYQYSQLVHAVNENWKTKKIFQPTESTSEIDIIESNLRQHGLKGLKLCGAGGSGFLLAMFEESIPLESIDPETLLKFKLQNTGLQTSEL